MSANSISLHQPLVNLVLPKRGLAHNALLALIGSFVVALCAQFIIPLPFTASLLGGHILSITGQTFAVLLVGSVLGWRLGLASLLAYLAEGALGLPVFSGVSGLAAFASPDAGYLLAFPLAAAWVGFCVERFKADTRAIKTFAVMLSGNLVIYAVGLAWLYNWMHLLNPAIDFGAVAAIGLAPFVIGDILKAWFAALLLPLARRLAA